MIAWLRTMAGNVLLLLMSENFISIISITGISFPPVYPHMHIYLIPETNDWTKYTHTKKRIVIRRRIDKFRPISNRVYVNSSSTFRAILVVAMYLYHSYRLNRSNFFVCFVKPWFESEILKYLRVILSYGFCHCVLAPTGSAILRHVLTAIRYVAFFFSLSLSLSAFCLFGRNKKYDWIKNVK